MRKIHGLASAAVLVLIVTLLCSAVALAAGYNAPVAGTSPHGSYTSTTNRCKICHAVHQATGTFRLLRDNSASTECDYCHGSSGVANKKPVRMDANGHGTIQAGPVYAPDDTTETSRFQTPLASWGCASCHSVHNNSTIQLSESGWATTKLLKKFPNPTKTTAAVYTSYDPNSVTMRLTQWCSACHNANIGLHTVGKLYNGTTTWYSHDASATPVGGTYTNTATWPVNPANGINAGPSCRECHRANGDPTYYNQGWPHSGGTAPDMLDTNSVAGSNQLDAVCISCHNPVNLP